MKNCAATFLLVLATLPPGAGLSLPSPAEQIAGDRLDVDIYGNLYVLDADKNTLRLYSKDLVLLKEVGGPGWHDTQFDHPDGLWARNGIDIFVADYGNHRIQRFDRQLNFISTFSTRDNDNPDIRFGYPTGVAMSRLGDLFICDGENSRIIKVDRFSQVERTFGGFDAGKGRLENPVAIQAGPGDILYVADGARVLMFDTFGNFTGSLYEGMFRKPLCLYADESTVAILDSSSLYCFDERQRPVVAQRLDAFTSTPRSGVRSMVFFKGSLYLLEPSGLVVLPDPRTGGGGSLDKDGKSH